MYTTDKWGLPRLVGVNNNSTSDRGYTRPDNSRNSTDAQCYDVLQIDDDSSTLEGGPFPTQPQLRLRQ